MSAERWAVLRSRLPRALTALVLTLAAQPLAAHAAHAAVTISASAASPHPTSAHDQRRETPGIRRVFSVDHRGFEPEPGRVPVLGGSAPVTGLSVGPRAAESIAAGHPQQHAVLAAAGHIGSRSPRGARGGGAAGVPPAVCAAPRGRSPPTTGRTDLS